MLKACFYLALVALGVIGYFMAENNAKAYRDCAMAHSIDTCTNTIR